MDIDVFIAVMIKLAMVDMDTRTALEAANGDVLQIIWAAGKLIFRHVAGKLCMFEEHLLGGLFVHFNYFFFQNFLVERNIEQKEIETLLHILHITSI